MNKKMGFKFTKNLRLLIIIALSIITILSCAMLLNNVQTALGLADKANETKTTQSDLPSNPVLTIDGDILSWTDTRTEDCGDYEIRIYLYFNYVNSIFTEDFPAIASCCFDLNELEEFAALNGLGRFEELKFSNVFSFSVAFNYDNDLYESEIIPYINTQGPQIKLTYNDGILEWNITGIELDISEGSKEAGGLVIVTNINNLDVAALDFGVYSHYFVESLFKLDLGFLTFASQNYDIYETFLDLNTIDLKTPLEDAVFFVVVGNLSGDNPFLLISNFVNVPIVEYTEDKEYYNCDVYFNIDYETISVLLNDVEKSNSFIVSDEGYYELIITDIFYRETIIYFIIDKTAPDVSGVTEGETFFYPTITFEDEYLLEVLLDDEIIATENGSITLDDNFTNKEYILIVRDLAGNETIITFILDNEIYEPLIILNGDFNTDVFKNTVTIELMGTYENVKLKKDGKFITFTNEIIEDGNYEIIVKYYFFDDLREITKQFIVDKTPPTVTGITEGETFFYPTITFEDKNLLSVKLNNQIVATKNGSITLDGSYANNEYTLIARDLAGNETVITFILDNEIYEPLVKLNGNINSNIFKGTANIEVLGIYESIELKKDGEFVTFTNEIIEDGNYEIIVKYDFFGDIREITKKFTIDKTAPKINGVKNDVFYKNVTISFEDENFLNAKLNGKIIAVENGSITLNDAYEDDEYTLIVTDKAGNVTTVKFYLDNIEERIYYLISDAEIKMENGIWLKTGELNLLVKNCNGYTIKLDGVTANLTNILQGKHELVIISKFGTTVNYTFYVDTKAPEIAGITDEGSYKEGTFYFKDNGDYFYPNGVPGKNIKEVILLDYNSNVVELKKLSGIYYLPATSGLYTLTVTDYAGNSTIINFTIVIDAPTIKLNGSTEINIFNSIVSVEITGVYKNAELIKDGSNIPFAKKINIIGNYIIKVVYDDGKEVLREFVIESIPKEIKFTSNIKNHEVTNENVIINSGEPLTIVLMKNYQKINYEFGQEIKEDGNYMAVITDTEGNSAVFDFIIIKKAKKGFSYTCPDDYEIVRYIKNGIEQSLPANTLFLNFDSDGTYAITVRNILTNETHSYILTIDTVPPELSLTNVKNGIATNSVKMESVTKQNVTIVVKKDGIIIDASVGTVLRENGIYTIELTDEIGNINTVTFTIEKRLNWTVLAISGAVGIALVAVFGILGHLKRKKSFNAI